MDEKYFPRTYKEALALMYVEKVTTAAATPEELLRKYNEALERINAEEKKIKAENPAPPQIVGY